MTGTLNVVVGITGGIAAYKAVGVIRFFVKEGHSVQVVATAGALKFVGRPTLEAISRNPVHTELYEGVAEVRHVALGQAADLIVIAPATANTIAKLAAGLADDLLGNTVLASTAPVVVAPAMHTEMWQNPATVANIATLRARGVTIVGPASGQLTGNDSGPGRMEEPETIVAAALERVRPTAKDLIGKRVVVTAGGTREPLDPVRYIGNRSSGKQGVALATAAAARGASVTLIASHLEVPVPDGIEVISAPTAADVLTAVTDAAATADITIMAAAIADYRSAEVRQAKIKKETTGDELTLTLVKNPDILATLAASHPRGLVVGFAAETADSEDDLIELGASKLERKGCDYLVLNRVSWSEGFSTDRNSVVMLSRGGDIVMKASGEKLDVAHSILDSLVSR
ncbi:phosphopantothenoylcysteine decarboxylase/phosphopantothenate--cysteine ligase [Okibacterium sp. HSC-33S16]|uniref:bifunctional phosphopantothenoylcysteine decarboxylase/phosphopantothenate--cysteine ligase CoaBC n=1 Tax=Okibacterium sp. HSC-33S16 TaxID=2910965 RepID=UPI00209E63D3|nr:bifunctional phosphopantothenoylcysteine decarboxylase/phosphopantothenate--cysteine ligase CoaBC [Okibacterium sp. HSC-33S16]MCP2030853.1 phosphopantothenoylcysteine decarboxylase/phosphopantothenate--cysteine ligase [Okibacterium sp. HSC-33S16]